MSRPVEVQGEFNARQAVELVALAYSAAAGAAEWQSFVDRFVQVTGGEFGYLWWADTEPGQETMLFDVAGARAKESATALATHTATHPLYTDEFVSWLRNGAVFTASRFVDMNAYRATEAHADVCSRQRVDDHLGITLVTDSPRSAAALSTYRSATRGAYDLSAERLTWAIAPHVSHAAGLSARRGKLPGRQPNSDALESFHAPSLVLDASARVLDANEAARRCIATARSVRIGPDRRLHGCSDAATSGLHAAVAAAVATATGQSLRPIGRAWVAPGVEATVIPFTRTLSGDATVLVVLGERADDPGASLTPQQRRVAEHLALGLTIRETSVELDLAPETVRSHVKEIYRRLGIASRAELARLWS